jgi:hypothetical protein
VTRRSLIACGAALTAHGLLAAGAEIQLSLSLEKKQYRSGEPILLTWTLENLGPRPMSVIAYEDAGGGRQYSCLSLHVSIGGGPALEAPTAFPSTAVRPVWKQIPSREALEQDLELDRSLALMVPKPGPGKYHLTAQYSLEATTSPAGDPAWNGHTTPATLDFEILP